MRVYSVMDDTAGGSRLGTFTHDEIAAIIGDELRPAEAATEFMKIVCMLQLDNIVRVQDGKGSPFFTVKYIGELAE